MWIWLLRMLLYILVYVYSCSGYKNVDFYFCFAFSEFHKITFEIAKNVWRQIQRFTLSLSVIEMEVILIIIVIKENHAWMYTISKLPHEFMRDKTITVANVKCWIKYLKVRSTVLEAHLRHDFIGFCISIDLCELQVQN